ncbi:hypothetical protein [Pontibacter liquoris]|uniref:hypothetical protein n=1 Tax=Pontibacter liquoris TaxID=2905677 RepID=UPI001FA7CCE0|nr:hypothetical protein [Pontibacter liquoris]
MRFFKLVMFVFILFNSGLATAQLNNTVLEQQLPVKSENANELRFGLYAFGFTKNNEYFNKIADGYTLFGYHLNPRLIYFPSGNVRVEAGALLWKDFGSNGYHDVVPTFTIKVQGEKGTLLFGTLEGNLAHGYIEPLYDFERVMTNRLENGVQYKLASDAVKLDTWIDWVHMLYRGEDDQEQLHGGAVAAFTLLSRESAQNAGDSLRLTLPVQFTAQHKGGQFDASELPLVTLANAAVGVELEKRYINKVLHRLYTKNYLVGFKDFSNTRLKPYEQGHGLYLNIGVDTKYQDVMLSYWQGDGYISELGGQLYQSASTTFKNPDYLQPERRLLILRLMKDFELFDNLYLSLRLEPVIDLDDPQLEFSNALYLTFDTDFFLAHPKR